MSSPGTPLDMEVLPLPLTMTCQVGFLKLTGGGRATEGVKFILRTLLKIKSVYQPLFFLFEFRVTINFILGYEELGLVVFSCIKKLLLVLYLWLRSFAFFLRLPYLLLSVFFTWLYPVNVQIMIPFIYKFHFVNKHHVTRTVAT